MRIIDLQRRLREIGRIRTGDQTVASNGKSRPRKLERFRLTSRDRKAIDAASSTWGGDVTEWQAPDGRQWQVYLEADELTVVVPPGDMSFSQSYEQWTAGGCKVRCDGAWDHLGDKACHCDPTGRDCNIHTRLSVIVPELPGIGVWRLETHSYYAAVELGGLVDLCAAQAAAGTMIPARLRLEQRSVKRLDDSGKPVTRRFAVPVLDLDVHPLALGAGGPAAAGIRGGLTGELPAPTFTPVPTDNERVLIPSVRDQIAAVDDPDARESRQTPLPATGLKPRTVMEATTAEPQPEPEPDRYTVADLARLATRVFHDDYDAAPKGDKTRTVDRLRHAAIYACTKGRTATSKACSISELARTAQLLNDIADGRITYTHDQTDDAGVTFTLPSGRQTTVLWPELEGQPGAGAELPLEGD